LTVAPSNSGYYVKQFLQQIFLYIEIPPQ